MNGSTLIAGFGSAHGDDQFGWQVIRELEQSTPARGAVLRRIRSPAELLDWLEGVEKLLIVDACESRGSPGRLHCWRWPDAELARVRGCGSHQLGLAAVLTLAETLAQLPGEIAIVCAEGQGFAPSAPMSAEVAAAVPQAVEILCRLAAPANARTGWLDENAQRRTVCFSRNFPAKESTLFPRRGS